MNSQAHHKVTANHLRRDAYLYVRQSTLRQVVENVESTKRQYGLRRRAVALGWPDDRVIVIDDDLGLSGASSTDRHGFLKARRRGRARPRGHRPGSRGLPARPQFHRLAPAARDLRPQRHPHP